MIAAFLAMSVAYSASVEVAPDVRADVECVQPGDWRISSRVEGSGLVRELVVDAASPTGAVPPRVSVSFRVPQVDVSCLWKSSSVSGFPMDWKPPVERASISQGQPLYALLDSNGGNRLTMASREMLRETQFAASFDERTYEVKCRF